MDFNNNKRGGSGRNNPPRKQPPQSRDMYEEEVYLEDLDYEDEGVVYTPSGAGRSQMNRQSGGRKRPVQQKRPAPAPQKKKSLGTVGGRKNQYAMFYIITLVVAVVICLAVFLMVFNSVTNKDSRTQTPNGGANPTPGITGQDPVESTVPVAANETSVIGMIRQISTSSRAVEIYDIENYAGYTFTVDATTVLKDKYGENMSFSELAVGDIVDARYAGENQTLSSVTISSKAWEQKNVSNVRVNGASKSIVQGNGTYLYTDELKVTYKGANYDVESIDPSHVLTMRGMDNYVWFVEISKGVGTVEIMNGEDLKDGVIEIGNSQSIQIDEGVTSLEENKLTILEGNYHVVVRGSNIEPITKELEVLSDQTVYLDLSDIQVTRGVLNIIANVTDAKVTIDGNLIKANEAQVLGYGSHEVKAEKDGYEPYTATVEIDKANQDLLITMNEVVQLTNVNIQTNPEGASIYIDNAYMGVSPIVCPVDMDTSVSRRLTVEKEGFVTVTIYMTKGQEIYRITLIQDPNYIPGGAAAPAATDPLVTDPAADPVIPNP